MTAFLIASGILIVASVLVVVRPLLWRHTTEVGQTVEQRALTLQVLRDQQAELEQERDLGSLTPAAYEQAHAELQRRLVDEMGAQDEVASDFAKPQKPPRFWAFALIFLIPLAAGLGYALWGNPMALQPGATEPQTRMTPEKITQMVNKLAARMKENPNDLDGWLKLAQAYKVMGRYAEAAEAYAKAETKVKTDAGLLASYAETLGMTSDKGLRGKPTVLINAALKLNPNEPNALLLAGAAAMERGEPNAAIAYWEQLLPMLEPGSEIEEALRDSIERVRQKSSAAKR